MQLFLGVIYVWSVFVAPVSEHYGWEVDSVKLTTSFMLCMFVVGIIVGGKMQARLTTQVIAFLGGATLSVGMLASGFVPVGAPWLIWLTYGVMGGLGVGVSYSAIISTAQMWFPEHRGFANGVSVCAFGLSTVLFAPLIEALLGALDVWAVFMALAAIFAAVVIAMSPSIKRPDAVAAPASHADAADAGTEQLRIGEMVRRKEYYLIALSLMMGTSLFFVLNPSLKIMALERGLTGFMATGLVMVTGVANAIGRLAVPMLSDRIGRRGGALAICAVTAACAVILAFAESYAFLAAVAVVSLCYGGYSGIYPVITADYFGVRNVGANYGAVMVGFALSSLAFPVAAGVIGEGFARFAFLGAAGLAGTGLVLTLILIGRKDGIKKRKGGSMGGG